MGPKKKSEDVQEPPAPKAPKAVREPKAPKAPKAPVAPKAAKEAKTPKEAKEPKTPKPPKEAKAPKEVKAPKEAKAPKPPKAQKNAFEVLSDEFLDAEIERQPLLEFAFRTHPRQLGFVMMHGSSQHIVNALARRWIKKFEQGRLKPVPDVPGAMCCEGYTTLDMAACSTAAERNAATAFIRGLSRTVHATRKNHLVLVYDAHLAVPSTVLQHLTGVCLVITTTCPHAMPKSLLSHALTLRVQCQQPVHEKMAGLVKAVLSVECIHAARKFAHESTKLCMGTSAAFNALLDAVPLTGEVCELAADLEHKANLITRPTHALELFALKLMVL